MYCSTINNVYPMYDFAHGQSDYFEGVTHSICTLEFEVHRPLYEYFVKELADDSYCPRQIEFNRLNLTYTVMSKRKLLQLVKEGLVAGWDDPRMPTICGLRRRGYTPESIKNFIQKIGYTKYDGIISVSLLEHSIREDLNKTAPGYRITPFPLSPRTPPIHRNNRNRYIYPRHRNKNPPEYRRYPT